MTCLLLQLRYLYVRSQPSRLSSEQVKTDSAGQSSTARKDLLLSWAKLCFGLTESVYITPCIIFSQIFLMTKGSKASMTIYVSIVFCIYNLRTYDRESFCWVWTWNFLHEILFPCRIQNLIKNGALRGLFSFYWSILLQGFDRKSRENVQKTLLRGSSYKMPKVKYYFFGSYILYIS